MPPSSFAVCLICFAPADPKWRPMPLSAKPRVHRVFSADDPPPGTPALALMDIHELARLEAEGAIDTEELRELREWSRRAFRVSPATRRWYAAERWAYVRAGYLSTRARRCRRPVARSPRTRRLVRRARARSPARPSGDDSSDPHLAPAAAGSEQHDGVPLLTLALAGELWHATYAVRGRDDGLDLGDVTEDECES